MTSVRALVKYSPDTIEISNNLRRQLDIWRKATDGIGRFSLELIGDWDGIFLADDPIQIRLDDVIVFEGYLDKGNPIAEGNVYRQLYKIVGRDYGQDLMNKQVNKTGDWMYKVQYADLIIENMLIKANSEITFTPSEDHKYGTDETIPEISYTDAGDEYLIEAFRKIFEKINYDMHVDDNKALQIFPIGSVDSGITLTNVPESPNNNLLSLKRLEFDSYDLRNYVIAKVKQNDDGWSDGNAADFTKESYNTVINDFVTKVKGTSSIRCTKGTGANLKLGLEFPKYHYEHLPFNLVQEDTVRFAFRVEATEDLVYGINVILEDTDGNQIIQRCTNLRKDLFHQLALAMGSAVEIVDYKNYGYGPVYKWHQSATNRWQFYTEEDTTFNWKIVKITWLMAYEQMSNVVFVTDMWIDNLRIPFPMVSYKQDGASQGSYKVRRHSFTPNNIRTQNALEEFAQSELDKLKNPLYGLRVTAIGSAGLLTNFGWTTPTGVHSKCGEIAGNEATKAIDQDLETCWAHALTCYHWIIFDMGETKRVRRIGLYQSANPDYRWGGASGLTVYVGENPADLGAAVWDGVLNGSGWQESGDFSKDGRYIKLVSKSNSLTQFMYEFDAYCATMLVNKWIEGYMVTVHSPGDGINNEEFRIAEAHYVISEQAEQGHDFIVEAELVPKELSISGQRLSNIKDPDIALLREISERIRYFETAEEAYRDYLPPFPADAAAKIKVGDFSNLAETAVAWTKHYEAEESSYDEEWVEVTDNAASKGKALKIAGTALTNAIKFVDGPLGVIGELYFLVRVKVSDRTKTGSIIVTVYDKDGGATLGSVTVSPSNFPANDKYHHFAVRVEIPADKQNIMFRLVATKGADFDLYCDYGGIVAADLPLGYADVTLSEHIGTDVSVHAGTDTDAHAGTDTNPHQGTDTDEHAGTAAASGASNWRTDQDYQTNIDVGTSFEVVASVTVPVDADVVDLTIFRIHITRNSGGATDIFWRLQESGLGVFCHDGRKDYLGNEEVRDTLIVAIPYRINFSNKTINLQLARLGGAAVNVDVTFTVWCAKKHTHTMTNPGDHAVTQPSNHSVTQPGDHAVTQPEDHVVTEPEDHTTESVAHEH